MQRFLTTLSAFRYHANTSSRTAEEFDVDMAKKVDEFITEGNRIHNNKYDYTLITAIPKSIFKVPIICPQHGVFKQPAYNHLHGKGCPTCSRANKTMSFAEFMRRLELVNNDRYTYMYGYKNTLSKVLVSCNTCNHMWTPTVQSLLAHKTGCPVCADRAIVGRPQYTDEHYKSLLTERRNGQFQMLSVYKNSKSKGLFQCTRCQTKFTSTPTLMLRDKCCPTCKS